MESVATVSALATVVVGDRPAPCWSRAPARGAANSTDVPARRAEDGDASRSRSRCGTGCRARTRPRCRASPTQFNSSQSDVKVNARQPDRLGGDVRRSTSPGSATGDLPDVVQLQETDQQQMIDTQTVLPASVCAKADKYSFSDFLPRVISYFTVQGTQYAMPFNTSGPVLYYNKKAFTAAGLDPDKPPTTLDEVRAAAEKLKANGRARRRSGSRPTRSSSSSGRRWRTGCSSTTATVARRAPPRRCSTTPTGRQIFTLDGRHGEGRPRRRPTPTSAPASFDDLLGIRQRLARDGDRHQRRARHDQGGARRGQRPEHRARGRADARARQRRARAACSTRAASCSW